MWIIYFYDLFCAKFPGSCKRPELRRYSEDTVILKTTAGGEIGILVDGLFQKDAKSSPVFNNDVAFRSKNTQIPVGHVLTATGLDGAGKARTNEVVAFARERPMAIREKVSWSKKYDDVEVEFHTKPFSLPVTLWVLYDKDKDGKIDKEKKYLAAAVLQTNSTWKTEKMGLLLVANVSDFKNALRAKNPKAKGYAKFSCGTNPKAKIASLKSDIGHVAGRINIYMVDEVKVDGKFAKFHGQTCLVGSDVMVIGSVAQTTLITHEIGHNLNLYHPPPLWMKSKDRKNENKKKVNLASTTRWSRIPIPTRILQKGSYSGPMSIRTRP